MFQKFRIPLLTFQRKKKYSKMIENAIDKAIKNKNLIVASVDDYTVVRSIQRPTGEQISHAVYMCTIIFRVFKDISAISWKSPNELNNPDGITSKYCVEAITSLESMHKLCQTYVSVMPEWLHESFFYPKMMRQRLNVLEYYQSENVQKLCSFDNLYLLEFKEQTLKSYSDFETAFQTITSSKLNEDLKRYCILLPGDHPAQLYAHQIIYKNSYPERPNSDEESNRLPTSDQASLLNQVNVSDPSNDDHCNRQQTATDSNVLQTTDHSTYLAKSAGVDLEKEFRIK